MDSRYMDLAFLEAKKALKNGEVPIGAVIVKNGAVISKAFNRKERKNCSLYHAELIAIKKASKKLRNWRLIDCDMYVTLDPCPMCASAIKQARIRNLYSALPNSNKKNDELISSIFCADLTNPSVNFISNLDNRKSEILLSTFFKNKRNK